MNPTRSLWIAKVYVDQNHRPPLLMSKESLKYLDFKTNWPKFNRGTGYSEHRDLPFSVYEHFYSASRDDLFSIGIHSAH